MSRYTGSLFKKSRRLEFSLLENDKEFSKGKKRRTPPGQHGDKKVKLSNYGEQLREKQKLSIMYGCNDKQMRRFVKMAKLFKIDGQSLQNDLALLYVLESRLDNLVYRMGFAPTRRAARQLVNHAHVRVNGKKVDIPSYIVNIGDEISVKDASKSLKLVQEAIVAGNVAPFVEVNKEAVSGKFNRYPERSELNGDIREGNVIEYYNKLG
jgi:small subunit ribosomal protein S4